MNQNEYLAHHGILGQKWGIRRFQNEDGTLTNAGKRRYLRNEKLIEDGKKYENRGTKKSSIITNNALIFAGIGAFSLYRASQYAQIGEKKAQNILSYIGTVALSAAAGEMIGQAYVNKAIKAYDNSKGAKENDKSK